MIKPVFLIALYSLISFVTATLFAMVSWLYYHYKPFELDRTITGFIIPALLAGIVVFFILRPAVAGDPSFQFRIKNMTAFCLFLAWAGVFIPLFFTGEAMKFFFPQIHMLHSPLDIQGSEKMHFYKFDSLYADKNRVFFSTTSNVTGKSSEYRRMGVCFVCPLLARPGDDSSYESYRCWTGVYYSRTDSRFAKDEFIKGPELFFKESRLKFLATEFSSSQVFYQPEPSGFRDNFLEALKKSDQTHPREKNIILLPLGKEIGQIQRTRFTWLFCTLAGGVLLWTTIVLLAVRFNVHHI